MTTTYTQVQIRNAHAALNTARKNFYKNPANRTRKFTQVLSDYLPKAQ